jgi:hypothetical protein
MDSEQWAWVLVNGTDAEYWQEAAEIEDWIEAGAPPVEEWHAEKRGERPKPLPSAPGKVDLPEVALALSQAQAAGLLGVSPDTFERHVLPELRVLHIGRRKMIPLRELEDYVSRKSARALEG